jgi:23S rRNA pseudoU1915 N3-methylase RlmH
VRCPSGHQNPSGENPCGECGVSIDEAFTSQASLFFAHWRTALSGRGYLVFGGIAGLILLVLVGSAAWSSWNKAQLLDRFDAAISADSLRDADVVVSQMLETDADEQRFSDAAALLDLLEESRSHFDTAAQLQAEGDYRAAYAEYVLVDQRDGARFDRAQAKAIEVQQLFEQDLLAAVAAKLEDDPRQAFWDIQNESDFLTNSADVVDMRIQAAQATMDDAENTMKSLVDAGNIIGAAKRWNLTSDALLEFATEFEKQTEWFATTWEAEKAEALAKVYSWTGGPDGLTRYFDKQAVQYKLSAGEITWITADALELHLYRESDSLSLYLKAMLYNPSWVMTESVVATIDGESWDLGFSADQIEQYEGTRNAWEGGWKSLSATDIDHLMNIAMSKTTTITFSGTDGESSFTLNAADKAGIQNMLLAYFALGGDPRSFW